MHVGEANHPGHAKDRALRGVPRRIAQLLLAVELAGIAWLVLNPNPSAPGRGVSLASRLMEAVAVRFGLPSGVASPVVWEFLLNVALFVPLTFLAVLLWPRPGVLAWTALSGLLTVFLESSQWLLLPTRSPTVSDLIANTAGGFTGALVAAVLLRIFPGRAQAVLGLFLATALITVVGLVLALMFLPVPVLEGAETTVKDVVRDLLDRAAARMP